jgi:hypothetical protein
MNASGVIPKSASSRTWPRSDGEASACAKGQRASQGAPPSSAPSEVATISTTQKNRPSVKTRFTDVTAGIKKYIASDVTIGGVKYNQAALIAVFDDAISAMDKADALHTQWLESVATTKTKVAQANAVYNLLRNFLIGSYGSTAKSTLGDKASAPTVHGQSPRLPEGRIP